MAKIPVGGAIAHGYRFAIGEFPKILGVIWIALVIQLGCVLLMMNRTTVFITGLIGHDPSATNQFGMIFLLYPLLVIAFFAQIAMVTELALGSRTVPPWLHVPLTRPVLRMIGAFVVALLAVVALVTAFTVAAAILVWMLTGLAGRTNSALVGALLFLVGYLGVILVNSRFMFLLAPVTSAEGRIGLMRAWRLSYGNFWRIFVITLAVVMPVIVAEYAVIFWAVGLPPLPHAAEGPQAYHQARLAWNLAVINATVKYWYISMPFIALLSVFWLGAGCGAQVFAYRALIASDPVTGNTLPD